MRPSEQEEKIVDKKLLDSSERNCHASSSDGAANGVMLTGFVRSVTAEVPLSADVSEGTRV